MVKSVSPVADMVQRLSFAGDLKDSYEAITSALERLPDGGQVIIDVQKCVLVNPVHLVDLIKALEAENKKQKQRILRGRPVIVLDPNEGLELLLKWLFREIHCSLLVAFSDKKTGRIRDQKVLNLPDYLSRALKIVGRRDGTTAHQLEGLLGKEYKTPARECLRQLYRRGLVLRTGCGPNYGGSPHFIFKTVKVSKDLQLK